MGDQNRGIYRKFEVVRTDGSSGPGGKHERCSYFVLDLDHDKYAIPALKAYAKACEKTHPELANHLRRITSKPLNIDALRRQIRRLQTGHEIESDYLTDHELDLQRDLDESRDQLAEAVQSLVAAQDEIEKLRAQLKETP